MTNTHNFLPVNKKDMIERGWEQPDFVFITGDAYVDHPSFGPAIISRVLEAHGYKICMIPQPDWKDDKSIDVFGRPRLGFLVSGGNMDSMVNHYTVSKKHRSMDSYSPGGKMGLRPDYATVVYCNLIRRTYKDVPIIIGGIEASLRRLAHYDYWSNKLKHSILIDSQADLLSYGMGEHSMVEIADALDSGIDVRDITFIRGTVYKTKDLSCVEAPVILPDYAALQEDRLKYAESFYTQYINTDPYSGKVLVEGYGNRGYVVQNPAAYPLTQMEMDDVYGYDYMNTYHPMYEKDGGIPAIAEVKFSLASNRGCFGGCSFCALTFHQGRIVQTRSHESIIEEAKHMTKDYLLADHDDTFLRELCQYHVSGQLRVAPEHISDNVLKYMGKPSNQVYETFIKKYEKINEQYGLKQYAVPYLMSSHPGSTLKDAVALAEYIRDIGYMPEQVQDFYPTPSTISTCMYYTGVDPRTMEPVYVARDPHEKAMQRALIQYRRPENYDLVKEALIKAGRTDLIGFEKHCLITPRKMDRNTSGHKDVHKKNPSGQATRNQNNKNSNHRKQDKSGKNSGSYKSGQDNRNSRTGKPAGQNDKKYQKQKTGKKKH